MPEERHKEIFTLMRHELFIARLVRELRDLPTEMSASPMAYLRAALLPDAITAWLPLSLANNFIEEVVSLSRHPIQFMKSLLSPDAISIGYLYQPAYTAVVEFTSYVYSAQKRHTKRSPLLISLLSVSATFHAVFITYMLYLAIIAPYANLRVVNKPYRQYDDKLIAVVPPALKLAGQSLENTLSLEEIQARECLRRAEEERRKREEERKRLEEERRKSEEEKIAQAKAEQEAKDKAAQAKAEAQKTNEAPAKFGEINEAPIKDILGKVYNMYQIGFAKVDVTNLSLMLSFNVEKDGTISNIKTMRSSGNNYIDTQAKAILWNLGESHALGPLSVLTSNTIKLDLTEKMARLSITGFAPTPDDAVRLARDLNGLFTLMRAFRKNSSPDVAELLSHMKVTSTGKRVDADLTISSDRAGEMMKSKFGKSGTQ
ncbi:MAG: TonB C-terminal domain-containing protein [Acidobacteria bacterium]|nr:TonB C-terminal domain-containing protein [Acidobacteriota bacterium]